MCRDIKEKKPFEEHLIVKVVNKWGSMHVVNFSILFHLMSLLLYSCNKN